MRRLTALARVCVAVALGGERRIRAELQRALSSGACDEDVREVILQTHLFAGFPKAINGLWVFSRLSPRVVRAAGEAGRATGRRRRGERLCRRIYGADYAPMMDNMRRLHPALAGWILEDGYGKVLSRPGLTAREREILVTPTLAALGTWRQVAPHLRGALRVGATRAELSSVVRGMEGLLGSRARTRLARMVEEQ